MSKGEILRRIVVGSLFDLAARAELRASSVGWEGPWLDFSVRLEALAMWLDVKRRCSGCGIVFCASALDADGACELCAAGDEK